MIKDSSLLKINYIIKNLERFVNIDWEHFISKNNINNSKIPEDILVSDILVIKKNGTYFFCIKIPISEYINLEINYHRVYKINDKIYNTPILFKENFIIYNNYKIIKELIDLDIDFTDKLIKDIEENYLELFYI
jgi:hypothetical protein